VGKIGVLICDDVAGIRALLRTVVGLSPRLRIVGEASDGREAIAEAARSQPDVVLLDLVMPNMDGLEALTEIRRVAPGARVVILSGLDASAMAEEALKLGAVGYLEKGADPAKIAATLEEVAGIVVPPRQSRVEIGGRRQGQEVWARWIDGSVQGDREFLSLAGLDPDIRFEDPHAFVELIKRLLDEGSVNVVLDVPPA
jgi:DNA-binding NarL/FixJ family response regulator